MDNNQQAPAPYLDKTVYRLFLDAYKEFDTKFDRNAQQHPVICFGVTGAGKSTLLARLLSTLPPAEFAEAALGCKEEFSKIEDVVIGHRTPSTTLVPVRYQAANGLYIFDVPGFKDNDGNKQTVINILHKCLLTRVTHAKFLIVVNVDVLFREQRLTMFITDYYQKLLELFGLQEFPVAVNSVFFVLTHNDKNDCKFTPDQIKKQIAKKFIEMADLPNATTQFLPALMGRLHTHHMVVDYSLDRDTLLRDLTALLETDATNGVSTATIMQDALDVHANYLNKECVAFLRRFQQQLTDRQSVQLQGYREQSDGIKRDLSNLLQKVATRNKLQTQAASLRSENATRTAQIVALADELVALETRIQNARAGLESFTREREFLDRTLNNVTTVSMRQDLSHPGSFGGWPAEWSSVVILPEPAFRESVVLVMEQEPEDRTLRARIGNVNSSLVPDSIEVIRQYKESSLVYYNSFYSFRGPHLKDIRSNYNATNSQWDLKVCCDKPFKVFIYTQSQFSTDVAANLLGDYYARNFSTKTTDLQQLTDRDQVARQETVEHKDAVRTNELRLKELDDHIKSAMAEVARCKASLLTRVKHALDYNNTCKEQLNAVEANEDVKHVNEILQIFQANNLHTTLSDVTKAYTDKIAMMKVELSECAIALGKLQDQCENADAELPTPLPAAVSVPTLTTTSASPSPSSSANRPLQQTATSAPSVALSGSKNTSAKITSGP